MKELPNPSGNFLFVGGTPGDPNFTVLPGHSCYKCYNCGGDVILNAKADFAYKKQSRISKVIVCLPCFKQYDDGNAPIIRPV